LDEMSAALGLAQLGRIEELLAKREQVAGWYNQRLKDVEGIQIPYIAPTTTRMSWFVYVIRLAPEIDRNAVMAALEERGIPSRPYFTPIHLQPFYRRLFGYREGDFPITEAVARSTLALPWRVWYDNTRSWMQQRINLTQFRGRSIVVYFNTYNDGAGGVTSMVIDDISLLACRPAPTPSPTAIALVVPTATFTPPPAGATGQQTPIVTLARATPTPSPTPAGLLGGTSTGTIVAVAAVITAILGSVVLIGLVLRQRRRQKPSGPASGTYGTKPVPPPPGLGPAPSAGAQPGAPAPPLAAVSPTTSAPGAPGGPPAPAGESALPSGQPYPRPVRVVSGARPRRITSVGPDVSPRMPPDEEEPEEPSEPAEEELGKEEQIDRGTPRRWIQLADKDIPPEEPPAEPAEDEDLPPW
ncbi:MAG: DegT/DnrJ/EryC1/StrS family aminotransferase, partial [Anaerolineae bacterium]